MIEEYLGEEFLDLNHEEGNLFENNLYQNQHKGSLSEEYLEADFINMDQHFNYILIGMWLIHFMAATITQSLSQ